MNLSDAKIMVVEDDPLMRTFTINLLKRLGMVHFHECADGTAALKAAITFQPDLVLTDVHMKPMNGLEFVQKLSTTQPRTKERFDVFRTYFPKVRALLEGEQLPKFDELTQRHRARMDRSLE